MPIRLIAELCVKGNEGVKVTALVFNTPNGMVTITLGAVKLPLFVVTT
jgi:hypothetical protein